MRAVVAVFLVLSVGGCKREKKPRPDGERMLAYKRLDTIPTFELRLSEKAREKLAKKPRKWTKAELIHDGHNIGKVGVRLKGHRSMRPIDDKPALKISIDKYDDDKTFLGVRKMTLNNMVEDPTRLREILGYRLYRELGVPAPAAFYANLIVDGQSYGLYAVIETVDEDFLEDRFEDASGGLYEGEYGCDLYPADVEGFDRDAGDDKERDDLRRLARAAEGPTEALFAMIDMDSFLAYLAVSAFIGDFDGYRHAHNYRIYHEPALDKWYFIPWGIDRAFKKRLSIYESHGRLAVRCFRDAKCRADYVRVQNKVVDAFAKLSLDEGALALAAFIAEADAADPKRPSAAKTNAAREKLVEFLRERPAEIRAETRCIDASGAEVDGDADGYGCLDCADGDPAIHPGAAELCDGIDNDCSGAVDDNPECPVCAEVAGAPGYRLCELPRPYVDAAEFCAGMGGRLARIDDAATAGAVAAAAAKASKKRWWIGLSDRGAEGEFRWSDGAAPGFADWRDGEPDNHTCNQDCAVIDPERDGDWHDTHCGQFFPFVCQVGAARATAP